VRLTPLERERLMHAAQIESQRRKVAVGMGTLLREYGMPGVDEILASDTATG
jgi:hypothetical protein